MSPCVGFRHPQDESVIPLADAPKVFDDLGVMPAAAVQAMVDDITGPKHKGPHLSPSIMDPATNCRRQVVGERYLDYVEDPMRLDAALEGSFFHWSMAKAGENLANLGFKVNVRMPAEDDGSHKATIEVFPGIHLSGEADQIEDTSEVTSTLTDHKTERYNPKDYAHERIPTWEIQLNIYRIMYEMTSQRKVTEMVVWRTYRGTPKGKQKYRKIPVRIVSREKLWERIGKWATEFLTALQKAEEIKQRGGSREEMEAHVASIRMDAHLDQHFSGWKCPNGCAIYAWCFRANNMVSF